MEMKFTKLAQLFCVCTVLLFTKVVGQNSVCFDGGSDASFAVGTAPQFVAVGDLNKDGKSDAIVVNKTTNNISVLVGNGDGTYAAAVNYSVGSTPYAVAIGDFNNDTIPDLIVANYASANVSLLIGKGDGTFNTATSIAAGGNGPEGVAVGDFNKDGKLDVAIAEYTGNKIGVLLGNGNGTFATAVTYTAGTGVNSVIVADFNRDGNPDIASSNNSTNNVSILLGNGSGTFATATNFTVGVNPYDLAAGDFNGDTIPDLAVANFQSGTVSVLIGTGSGSFNTALTYTTGTNPSSITVADFNGDGKLDLATPSLLHNTISVGFGNGDGTFTPYKSYTVGAAPLGIASGMINGDKFADIIATDRSSNAVSVLLNKGDGNFQSTGSYSIMGTAPYGVATADFNRDGVLDLVTANNSGNNLTLALGGLNGVYQTASTISLGSNTKAHSLIALDLNGDSIADIAVTNAGNSNVSVLLGKGDGTFAAPVNYTVGSTPYGIAAGDFNLDKKIDLVVTNYAAKTVSVLLGNGDGTYQAATNITVGTNPASVAVADFNGDNNPDLAVTNFGTNASTSNVMVLLGTGSGTFGTPSTITVGTNPNAIALGDFNGDTFQDIAVTNYATSNVSVMLGVGNGTFAAANNFSVGANPNGIALGDFNQDGNLDIATSNLTGSNASVLVGLGTGQFNAAINFEAGYQPRSIVSADFNQDGLLDLAVANSSSNTVSVLFNTTATLKAIGSTTICSNGSVLLKATKGGFNYSWSPVVGSSDSLRTNQAGNYNVTISNLNGTCITTSSNITLNVVAAYQSNNPQTICANGTYLFNKHVYASAGNYNDTLKSILTGCDSIVTTQLTVLKPLVSNNPQTVCANATYTFNNHVYNKSGNFNDTLKSLVSGCDSIVITQLTVLSPIGSNNPQTVCFGGSYTFNNHVYNKSGNFNDTLKSFLTGCDSIITTQLTVLPRIATNNPQIICPNSSYTFNNHIYSKAGAYNDTLISKLSGCDSIVITQITVLAPQGSSNFQTICANTAYTFNNHAYDKTGTFRDTLTCKTTGCDSIVTTHLTVLAPITVNNPQAICVTGTYAINNHIYSKQGTYTDTLISKSSGCDSIVTTQLTVNLCTGIAPIDGLPTVKLYPNPSNGQFTLDCANISSGKVVITVYNIVGKEIYTSVLHANQSIIDLTGQASGIYFVRVQNEQGFVTKRLVIE